jgi:hypothetical protein
VSNEIGIFYFSKGLNSPEPPCGPFGICILQVITWGAGLSYVSACGDVFNDQRAMLVPMDSIITNYHKFVNGSLKKYLRKDEFSLYTIPLQDSSPCMKLNMIVTTCNANEGM